LLSFVNDIRYDLKENSASAENSSARELLGMRVGDDTNGCQAISVGQRLLADVEARLQTAAQIITNQCHALALAHAALVAADEHRERAHAEALAFITGGVSVLATGVQETACRAATLWFGPDGRIGKGLMVPQK
jgi:hypothetical protein